MGICVLLLLKSRLLSAVDAGRIVVAVSRRLGK
jgi:hypothetical protein